MAEPIDSAPESIPAASDELARQIIQACTSVSTVVFAGYGLVAIFLASWIPTIYAVARWACVALLVILPIAYLVWRARCRKVEKADPLVTVTDPGWSDYVSAKGAAARALVIWGIVLIGWVAQPFARGWIAIQTIPSKPDTLVALRDRGGQYWVILADSIEKKGLSAITVRTGALVAHARGSGSAREIVDDAIEQWKSVLARSPGVYGGFGVVGQSWNSRQTIAGGRTIEVSGDVARAREPVIIDIAEVVLTRER